jgi:hypothetical protein
MSEPRPTIDRILAASIMALSIAVAWHCVVSLRFTAKHDSQGRINFDFDFRKLGCCDNEKPTIREAELQTAMTAIRREIVYASFADYAGGDREAAARLACGLAMLTDFEAKTRATVTVEP